MNYKIQIISLIYSFGYGMFFYFFSFLNDKLSSKNEILNVVTLIAFVLLNALLYITILYKINFGVFHIYFLIMIILGYYFSLILKKIVSNNVKSWKNIIKRKNI